MLQTARRKYEEPHVSKEVTLIRSVRHAVFRAILLGPVVFGPIIVGVPPRFDNAFGALAVGAFLGCLFCLLWILSGSRFMGSQKIVLAIVSCFVLVTLMDLVSRPFVASFVKSPEETFDWPSMPLVKRLFSDERYQGTAYGELAAGPALRQHRQYREFTFITDHFGFRNEGTSNQPLDVIVLGDSFGTGSGTTQDKVWSAILSKQYGLAVYNLSMNGNGPWHEYTDFTIEIDRLKLKDQETVVLWTLFTGNDLTDPCYPIFDKRELPWHTGVATLRDSLRKFRALSPLGQSLARLLPLAGIGRAQSNKGVVVRRFPDGTETLFLRAYDAEVHRGLEGVRHHPNYDCVRQTVLAMKKFAESRNLAIGIMVAPTKEEVYSWLLDGGRPWSTLPLPSASGFALAIGEICREEHIPVLDLKPLLVAAAERIYQESGGQLYWRDDTHWSADGNMEVAKIVYQFYTALRSGKQVH